MSRTRVVLFAPAIGVALFGVLCCHGDPSERELRDRGFFRSPSEEAVAWPDPNRLVVLWSDEWRSGPDVVWTRCRRTGLYEIDSIGGRRAIRAGRDVCDPVMRASSFAMSGNGGILVYGDTTEIHWLDLTSGARHDVTPSGLGVAAFPSLSPDGTRLAFFAAESRGDSASDRRGLYLAGSDGSSPRLLFPLKRRSVTAGLSWSPDMSQLTVSVYPNTMPYEDAAQVVILDTVGGQVRVLAIGRSPAWSPTGDWIAYLSNGWRSQADGSNPRIISLRVVRPDGTDDRLVFSPSDSTTFGAFSPGTITGSPEGRVVWSSDGRSIAFPRVDGGGHTLWAIDVDGSRLRRLTKDSEDR